MIGPWLAALVATSDSLKAIVGARVEPSASRQNDLKGRIVFYRISGRPLRHLGGRSGMNRPRYQLDCYGRDHTQAELIATMLEQLIEDTNGQATTLAGVTICASIPGERRDDFSTELGGPEGVRFVSFDCFFWHAES